MKKYQKFYFILGKEAVHETRAGGFLKRFERRGSMK